MAFAAHEPRSEENPELLRYVRLLCPQCRDQIPHRERAAAEFLEQAEARRLREHREKPGDDFKLFRWDRNFRQVARLSYCH